MSPLADNKFSKILISKITSENKHKKGSFNSFFICKRVCKLLVLLTVLFTSVIFAQNVDERLFGIWQNADATEFLKIDRDLDEITFERRDNSGLLSWGIITVTRRELRIERQDILDNYDLVYFIRDDVFVVAKPRSTQAWLWTKVQ